MKLPIVLADGYDITIHMSAHHAVTGIEPADLRSNSIVAYDGEGNLLDLYSGYTEDISSLLWVKWKKRRVIVKIREHEPIINRSLELRKKLTHFLLIKGFADHDVENYSLEELLRSVANFMPWKVEF